MKKLILSLALVGLVSGVSLVKANTVVAAKDEAAKVETAAETADEEDDEEEMD